MSKVDKMQAATLTNPYDFADIHSLFETEVLNLEPTGRALVASDVAEPLHLTKLKVLGVSHCELSLRRILDEQTLCGVTMIGIANSKGSLLEMGGIKLANLSRLNLLNLLLCEEELRWVCSHAGLISLQFANCLELPTDTLTLLSSKGVLRSLSLSGSWSVLCAESIEDCFSTVRFLDLSKIRIPSSTLDQLVVAFPNVECFFASGCGLSKDEVEKLASCWSALKILQTGNRDIDFHKHHSSQWSDVG